jgi:nucleoside-diphosphate kinase
MERTLSLIKPDGVKRNLIGEVIKRFENEGLKVIALKMLCLTKKEVKVFYAIHQGQPFFDELTNYMSSGPIVAMVLEGIDAIKRTRKVMGATDPNEASPGSIRAAFGINKGENTVHGSDSLQSAITEISFFFSQYEWQQGQR